MTDHGSSGWPTENRRFILRLRPVGEPRADDFALISEPIPDVGDGEFLIRNQFVSLDPAMRGWIDDRPSYQAPVALGSAMRATTAGVVARSRNPTFPEGTRITGLNAVEDYTLVSVDNLKCRAVPPVGPLTHHLSVLGGPGVTAYFGLLDVGCPVAGETVLVTAAAGAVGSVVGQIAKLKGCRTIGVAGGTEKCARLLDRYGYDAAIDYRGKDGPALAAAIADVAPDGVDLIFENVGGEILDAGLCNLKTGGRVALCGLVSDYNRQEDPQGTRQLWQLIVKRARIEGFLLSGYMARYDEAVDALRSWVDAELITFDEHIEFGMDKILPAFLSLFAGSNRGKTIVELD
jgi:NADPH-dependent curcumin reductase CurA